MPNSAWQPLAASQISTFLLAVHPVKAAVHPIRGSGAGSGARLLITPPVQFLHVNALWLLVARCSPGERKSKSNQRSQQSKRDNKLSIHEWWNDLSTVCKSIDYKARRQANHPGKIMLLSLASHSWSLRHRGSQDCNSELLLLQRQPHPGLFALQHMCSSWNSIRLWPRRSDRGLLSLYSPSAHSLSPRSMSQVAAAGAAVVVSEPQPWRKAQIAKLRATNAKATSDLTMAR